MAADLQIDPDVVEELARLAHRIADDLDGAADVARPVAELRAFAAAAGRAARRAREADRDAAAGFR